jgi:hypothetical protein
MRIFKGLRKASQLGVRTKSYIGVKERPADPKMHQVEERNRTSNSWLRGNCEGKDQQFLKKGKLLRRKQENRRQMFFFFSLGARIL